MVVVCVREAEVPVTVTVDVPLVAFAAAVRVRVLEVVVGLGAKAAVTPAGNPEALKVTLPLKPFSPEMVMLLVPLLPCVILIFIESATTEKSGPGTTFTITAFDSIPLAT